MEAVRPGRLFFQRRPFALLSAYFFFFFFLLLVPAPLAPLALAPPPLSATFLSCSSACVCGADEDQVGKA